MSEPRPEAATRTPPSGFGGGAASTFAVTGFGAASESASAVASASDAAERSAAASASPFDVCHVGVVLRVVCFVHGVVALGTAFAAGSAGAWLVLFALGSVVALPALLLWLIMACLLRSFLVRLPAALQWMSAVVLGGVCGAAGWAQLWFSGLTSPPASAASADSGFSALSGGGNWPASVAAGAAFAAAIFLWLTLRARTQLPADQAARLAELQSRIRPHFLFNTLNSAIALARVDPARTEGLLEDLAELFRVALSDTGSSVSLAEEVDLAQRYLAIEQIRFGDRLRVTWDLDGAAGEARVPPLLLQPLVENAVRHGVEPADEGGVIRIRTRVQRGQAIVTIANTVPVGRPRPGHGIAMDNVRERLRLMHDVSSRFESGMDGEIHRVQIVVPL